MGCLRDSGAGEQQGWSIHTPWPGCAEPAEQRDPFSSSPTTSGVACPAFENRFSQQTLKPSASFNSESATLEGDALQVPSALYLQALCRAQRKPGALCVRGRGTAPAPGQERRIVHRPPARRAGGSMGMTLPPSCTPRLCQRGSQQDLQRSELPPADVSPGRG